VLVVNEACPKPLSGTTIALPPFMVNVILPVGVNATPEAFETVAVNVTA
jgi:hypothetical protein